MQRTRPNYKLNNLRVFSGGNVCHDGGTHQKGGLLMTTQGYIKPENQSIKGIFVFKSKVGKLNAEALDLLKSVNCRVLSSANNRITVSSSRGNLQKIKRCWQDPSERSSLSAALHKQISQIILGGNV